MQRFKKGVDSPAPASLGSVSMAAFRHRQRTYVLKPAEARRKWHLVDARGQAPGRLAVKVAGLLRGKDNPRFTPHTDSGDFVVVVNAGGVVFSGDKLDQKIYYRHSGYVGGLKRRTAREQSVPDLLGRVAGVATTTNGSFGQARTAPADGDL